MQPVYPLPTGVLLVENSWVAKVAARFMGCQSIAIVFGSTIHVCGVSRHQFLRQHAWVRHELCHVRQYQQLGMGVFICQYVWQWMLRGYHNNKFEIEARAAEQIHD